MRCHPLLTGFAAPRTAVVGPYHLHILGPDHVEEDFAAVIESADRLTGFMGGTWPQGLSLEGNRIDLCWHFKEFQMNRSFAWIIRNSASSYLGCAYVFPDFQGNRAAVSVWMRSRIDAKYHENAFGTLMIDWLNGPEWPDFDYRLAVPEA